MKCVKRMQYDLIRLNNNIVNDEHHILLSKDTVLVGKILNVIKSKNHI